MFYALGQSSVGYPDYKAIFLYVHHLNLRHPDQGTQNDIHIANNINFLNAFNEGVGM